MAPTRSYADSQRDKEIQDKQLASATAWQRKPRAAATPIGNELKYFLEWRLAGCKKVVGIEQIFAQSLPPELAGRCQAVRFQKGVLYVQCQSGSYAHLMEISRQDILKTMKKVAPKTAIKSIQVLFGRQQL